MSNNNQETGTAKPFDAQENTNRETKQLGYMNRVNHHIYATPADHGCRTLYDWIELAAAAMDQAGFTVGSQDKIRSILEDLAAREGIVEDGTEH